MASPPGILASVNWIKTFIFQFNFITVQYLRLEETAQRPAASQSWLFRHIRRPQSFVLGKNWISRDGMQRMQQIDMDFMIAGVQRGLVLVNNVPEIIGAESTHVVIRQKLIKS